MTEITYIWATDAASGTVEAADADAALAMLVADGEWAEGAREARDIADGAWLLIRSDEASDEIRRGTMP